MNALHIAQLKKEFGKNKDIPAAYEKEILLALSHYSELKDIRIKFKLAKRASVPYDTKPSLLSCFLPSKSRSYTITLLENADLPEKDALFKQLEEDMRVSVIGHELGHVQQFCNCSSFVLLKKLASFAVHRSRRRIERGADLLAIKHGLGEGLLKHARYIRSIPGYLEKRPSINEDYLKPFEISHFLKHPEKISRAL